MAVLKVLKIFFFSCQPNIVAECKIWNAMESCKVSKEKLTLELPVWFIMQLGSWFTWQVIFYFIFLHSGHDRYLWTTFTTFPVSSIPQTFKTELCTNRFCMTFVWWNIVIYFISSLFHILICNFFSSIFNNLMLWFFHNVFDTGTPRFIILNTFSATALHFPIAVKANTAALLTV